jgi:hypothetical protein
MLLNHAISDTLEQDLFLLILFFQEKEGKFLLSRATLRYGWLNIFQKRRFFDQLIFALSDEFTRIYCISISRENILIIFLWKFFYNSDGFIEILHLFCRHQLTLFPNLRSRWLFFIDCSFDYAQRFFTLFSIDQESS